MYFIPDRVQKTLKSQVGSVSEELQPLLPPTLPNTTSEVERTQSTDDPLPTHTGFPASTTVLHARSHRSLFLGEPSVLASKRKHEPKPRPILDSEDTSTDTDNPSGLDGDGSSSGESIDSDAQAPAKRPRTSVVTTRSSARTATLSIAEVRIAVQHEITPPDSIAVTTPFESADPQPLDTPVDSMDVDDVTSGPPPMNTYAGMDLVKAITPPVTTKNTIAIESAEGGSEQNPDMSPITDACPIVAAAAAPTPLGVIEPDEIPAFLRTHGTGNRRVDIFGYLNDVKDPRFQQVLFHYFKFEVNDKSTSPGSLPTAKRPPEVAQWTARARPAGAPDYPKGKRTFSMFVDSVFIWWGSIQPSWRSFERGVVSRRVRGKWGALYAPRINGMLNVVILVYWWILVLEEQKPKDGDRADYDFFADDVSWALSQLIA